MACLYEKEAEESYNELVKFQEVFDKQEKALADKAAKEAKKMEQLKRREERELVADEKQKEKERLAGFGQLRKLL